MVGLPIHHALVPAVMAIVLSTGSPAPGTEIPFKIDEPTAKRLAAEGRFGADTHLDAFNYGEAMGAPFFVYYGLEPDRDGGFGYFAVNPWTGDVWSLWDCRRLSTPLLRKSQAEIRRRFTGKELRHYAELNRRKPECM